MPKFIAYFKAEDRDSVLIDANDYYEACDRAEEYVATSLGVGWYCTEVNPVSALEDNNG